MRAQIGRRRCTRVRSRPYSSMLTFFPGLYPYLIFNFISLFLIIRTVLDGDRPETVRDHRNPKDPAGCPKYGRPGFGGRRLHTIFPIFHTPVCGSDMDTISVRVRVHQTLMWTLKLGHFGRFWIDSLIILRLCIYRKHECS